LLTAESIRRPRIVLAASDFPASGLEILVLDEDGRIETDYQFIET
jgi:hypothetical protein